MAEEGLGTVPSSFPQVTPPPAAPSPAIPSLVSGAPFPALVPVLSPTISKSAKLNKVAKGVFSKKPLQKVRTMFEAVSTPRFGVGFAFAWAQHPLRQGMLGFENVLVEEKAERKSQREAMKNGGTKAKSAQRGSLRAGCPVDILSSFGGHPLGQRQNFRQGQAALEILEKNIPVWTSITRLCGLP